MTTQEAIIKLRAMGLFVTPDPHFADYVLLNGHQVEAVEAASEADEAAAEADDDDDVDDLAASVVCGCRSKPRIEYCTSAEVLASEPCNLAGDEDHTWASEVAEAYGSAAINAIEDSVPSDCLIAAQRDRILCPAWDGAQFFHRAGIFGTFANLTPAGQKAIEDANAIGLDAANKAAVEFMRR